mmetsp:Transcript_12438/g.31767  ORF Transcript_12438/g.31767 Transcript_12438/m.31767 type:complete len:261 (+) Transcript_12438:122-904(+)|eukprot:CAMPEP_0115859860 /NCGR_PEP_ID=MMETSP0287-20121206/16832_1 /TAXON_ID=412157 /ORGANISM="Chrysochromulina rotalis, Strain UIO044" /LENGTH=260 /DNA_ID=CAMNT_0003314171 /DNA_START=99 /DNA_END=881 /DNA_ORIENTATION=-
MSRFLGLEACDLDEAIAATSTSAQIPGPLEDPLFWIDLEMTGLNAREHHILELAIIASDGELLRTVDGPNMVVHQDESVLNSMNEWSTEQHSQSGLTERCRESRVSLADAERDLITFVSSHCPDTVPAVLAGACVYKDLEFIEVHMPRLRALLSHRVVDVSTVRSLCRLWYPGPARRARASLSNATQCTHRALDDIRYSIRELKYYRQHCFRPMGGRSGARPNAAKQHHKARSNGEDASQHEDEVGHLVQALNAAAMAPA